MGYIQQLRDFKKHVSQGTITQEQLSHFISINKRFTTIEELHPTLLTKVCEILQKENSKINYELLSSTCNPAELLEKMESGKSANGIYLLDNTHTTTYAFGDIHGDSLSIDRLLHKISFVKRLTQGESIRILFLGDYIDRGRKQLRALEYILLLKLLFPKNVFLLRGNHDGGTLLPQDEYKLCVGRGDVFVEQHFFMDFMYRELSIEESGMRLLRQYLDFFASLPTTALLLDKDISRICVHGGIPRPQEDKFDHLNALIHLGSTTTPELLDTYGDPPSYNIMWSDPTENPEDKRNTRRFYFYKNQFENFMEHFSCDYLIRAHQSFPEGCRTFFDGKLFSIFSSGATPELPNMETAYANILPCVLEMKDKENTPIFL